MAENLNLQYAPAPSLQEGFIDKSTGELLAFGRLYSFKNESRTELKPLFELKEALPGGPVTYVPLPNPIILSGIGTIQNNNGDDVIPYYFPFDANGNVEYYYLVVTDSSGAEQFTREAFPNQSSGGSPVPGNAIPNYIPNGQLLIHNGPSTPNSNFIYENTSNFVYTGLYSNVGVDIQYIAQGGYTFERTHGSSATDVITFPRATQFNGLESGSPRFNVEINRSAPSGDAVCDLRIKFNDVFKFTSPDQIYSFLFTARSLNGADLMGVQILTVDYYGTGGTPSHATEESIGSITILAANENQYSLSFSFPLDTNTVLGTNDDDFVQLVIRFPTAANQLFNVQFTDFILVQGMVTNITFPTTTNGQFLDEASFNNAPNNYSAGLKFPVSSTTSTNYYYPEGWNLFLPFVNTSQGLAFDFSQISNIENRSTLFGFFYNGMVNSIANNTNLLLCDGSSYITSEYSALGIPFARLQSVVFDSSRNLPAFGTGSNFVTSFQFDYDPSVIRLNRNSASVESIPVNGAISTGFSIAQINPGVASNFDFLVGVTALGPFILQCWGITPGVTVFSASAGTSGLIVGQVINASGVRQIFDIDDMIVLPPNSSYFQFGNTTTQFYMWFSINGAGVNPSPGGTGIKCNLLSSYTETDFVNVVQGTLSGEEIDSITVTGIPPNSSFFVFTSQGKTYNVWYQVDGIGSAPSVPINGANILVSIGSADNTATIANKTCRAINSYQFAVPDCSGMFLRGFSSPNGFNFADTDPTNNRYLPTNQSSYNGNLPGTIQVDTNQNHSHPGFIGGYYVAAPPPQVAAGAGFDFNISAITGFSGFVESRPRNVLVVYAIRY